jgi:anti-anti-sigma regulatory factor
MDAAVDDVGLHTWYRCPVCGASLLDHTEFYLADDACRECGANLWCWRQEHEGVVILVPIPQRTPATADVESLVRALRRSGTAARVGVDLSSLEVVSSSWVAELVILHRRIREAGGRLFLFGLNPYVRASLHRFRLDQVFEIVEPEDAAAWAEPAALMAAH